MNELHASPQTDSAMLKLNGEPVESTAATLASLLAGQGIDPAKPGIAVAVNGVVVPRASWADLPVKGGDTVEVITAMQGG